ncbi:50S ribosomal protein L21e [Candidatus Woesearchaeota archaeon]|nr:50S ribosomal protein L21e [Candidatus Woesearchaeota archaeon]
MVQRKGGLKRKTRNKLSKNIRRKGKISLQKYFQTFEIDQKTVLLAEPSVNKGMYHPRFYGKTGTVSGKRGDCYLVDIKDGSLKKTLIVHPVHMRPV